LKGLTSLTSLNQLQSFFTAQLQLVIAALLSYFEEKL
jgi:hypothetical protein